MTIDEFWGKSLKYARPGDIVEKYRNSSEEIKNDKELSLAIIKKYGRYFSPL